MKIEKIKKQNGITQNYYWKYSPQKTNIYTNLTQTYKANFCINDRFFYISILYLFCYEDKFLFRGNLSLETNTET